MTSDVRWIVAVPGEPGGLVVLRAASGDEVTILAPNRGDAERLAELSLRRELPAGARIMSRLEFEELQREAAAAAKLSPPPGRRPRQ